MTTDYLANVPLAAGHYVCMPAVVPAQIGSGAA
jgi:hypothetical protein